MNFEGAGKVPEAPWEANRLIALRRELGLTLEEMARRIKVRTKTLQMWESGRGRATAWAVPHLEKLEKRFNQSQDLKLARKKGAFIRYVDGKPVRVMPRRRPEDTVSALGSTQGRMAEARVELLKTLLQQRSVQSRDRVAQARLEILGRMLKHGDATPRNRASTARVEMLKRRLKEKKASAA